MVPLGDVGVYFIMSSFCVRKRFGSQGSQALQSHGVTVDIVLLDQSQCRFVQSLGGFSARAPGLPHLVCSHLSRNVDFCCLLSTCGARNGFLCSCSFWKSETKLCTSVRLTVLISGCFLGHYRQEKDCPPGRPWRPGGCGEQARVPFGHCACSMASFYKPHLEVCK